MTNKQQVGYQLSKAFSLGPDEFFPYYTGKLIGVDPPCHHDVTHDLPKKPSFTVVDDTFDGVTHSHDSTNRLTLMVFLVEKLGRFFRVGKNPVGVLDVTLDGR